MYYFSRYPLLLSIDNSVFMYKLKVVHNKQLKELDSQKIKKKKERKKPQGLFQEDAVLLLTQKLDTVNIEIFT